MYPSFLLADLSLRSTPRPRRDRVVRGGRKVRYGPRAHRSAPRGRRFRWSWLALAVLIAAVFGGLSYLRVWPPLATVMSASMSPTIKTGDIVVLKKLGGPAQVGDIVAISVPEDIRSRYGYPPVIIHRVVRIDAAGVVTTKGDAYKDPDPFEVPRSALTTKVVATVPAAGRALAFLGSGLGLLWLAGGAVAFFGMPLVERYRDGQRRQAGNQQSLQETLQAISEELGLLRSAPAAPSADAELRDMAADAADERQAITAVAERREHELEAALVAAAEREDALAAELRAATEDARRREQAMADQLRGMADDARRREEAMADQLRAIAEDAQRREQAMADEVQAVAGTAAELRAATVSLTEAVEVAERRATTAEEQLRAHLEALPAQIERAVALALSAHTPPPAPPPPPTRRFVPASQWTSAPATWGAPAVLTAAA
jgi:signal peptidase I